MTTKNIELVKESWQLVAQIDMEIVGGLFYGRLFEIAPEVKPMFNRSPIPEQSKKLLTMLSYVISKLDKLDEILDEVAKLARRHTKYGVADEHYIAVGDALLWTLQKGLGEHWNEELNTAWTDIYGLLSAAMISAQKNENVQVATL
ncbi:MAG: globin family protein [Ferruginibacter sp.]